VPRQKIRLFESRESDSFDDQKSAAQIATSESLSENHQQFLEYLLSQVKRIIHGNQSGNWHDDPASVHGGDASLYALFSGSGGVGFDEDTIVVSETLVVVADGNVVVAS